MLKFFPKKFAMVLERERDIIKLFITETLGAFCKSHLAYSSQITIDGLVGVTIDQNNVILVTIKESIELSEKTGNGYVDNVNNENHSAETSDSSFHFSINDLGELDRSQQHVACDKVSSKFMVPYQCPESVSMKIEDSVDRSDERNKAREPAEVLQGEPDYGLDLSIHTRNPITIIKPDNLKDETDDCMVGMPGNSVRHLEPDDCSFSPDFHSRRTLAEKTGFRLSPENKQTSKHLILPFFMAQHRTNLKKRKIHLLSHEHSERNFVPDAERSALSGCRGEEIQVKMEHSSPVREAAADGAEPVEREGKETAGCNLSSAGKSILGGTQPTSSLSSSSNRWLGSGQLQWADFQNMLIKSWRRNHHEEMLLKPLAHALIESWTNLSDTTSHKRIGECVQAILLYEGRYVPVRDIQRLRLSSMTSQEIRSTMEFLNSTREGKVGCYREIRGGIGVFYKCPPHLVDMEFLESFGLTLAIYETRYSSRMVSNATNRHSAVYWYRIETCSPYLTSTEVL